MRRLDCIFISHENKDPWWLNNINVLETTGTRAEKDTKTKKILEPN